MRLSPIILLFCAACAPAGAADTTAAPQDALALAGKADGPQVHDLALDQHLAGLSISAVDSADVARGDVLPGVVVLRLPVQAGQRFALVMAAQDASFDAQLWVRLPGDESSVGAAHQTLLPEVAASDAVFVGRASSDGQVVAVATSVAFASGGTFSINGVSLREDPGIDLSLTSAAPRQVLEALRVAFPDVRRLTASGAIIEGDDGLLATSAATDPLLSPLELASRNTIVARVNQDRLALFEALIRDAQAEDPGPMQRNEVGTAWAELERALRAIVLGH